MAISNIVLMKINLREKEFIALTILVSNMGKSQQQELEEAAHNTSSQKQSKNECRLRTQLASSTLYCQGPKPEYLAVSSVKQDPGGPSCLVLARFSCHFPVGPASTIYITYCQAVPKSSFYPKWLALSH